MATAIVPTQHTLSYPASSCECQYAFEVSCSSGWRDRLVLVLVIIRRDHPEKVRRRQLFMITNDNHLPRPSKYAESFFGRNLASLIDHHDVEREAARRQKLCNGHWAHEENGFQSLYRRSRTFHELSNG